MRQVIAKTAEEYADYVRSGQLEGAGTSAEEIAAEVAAHLLIIRKLGGDVLTVTGRRPKDATWHHKVIHVRGSKTEGFVLRGQVKEIQQGSTLSN